MSIPAMVGASREVMEHHDQMHRRQCTSDPPAQIFKCPCAVYAVIIFAGGAMNQSSWR